MAMLYILQYCYGFNRLQLWLLAQGLLQSVSSLQVSAWGNAILQYCNGFNRKKPLKKEKCRVAAIKTNTNKAV